MYKKSEYPKVINFFIIKDVATYDFKIRHIARVMKC